MNVVLLNGGQPEDVGVIPAWLDESDMRPAREQLDDHYQHGGGWRPFKGFKMSPANGWAIVYEGDDPLEPLALMKLRNEVIAVYPHAWVMILQPSGSFEICRMD